MVQAQAVAGTRGTRRARRRPGSPRFLTVLGFLAPGLIIYLTIYAYPVLTALTYSLFNWRGISRQDFAGLENFRRIMTLQPYAREFTAAIGNNIYFFVGTLILQGIGGMLLALALSREIKGRRLIQTLVSLPYLMSSLVIGYIWSLILAPEWGPVNNLLTAIGLESWSRPWLGDPDLIMPILLVINLWQWVGAGMLIFGAALAQIPLEQVEAARMDGAGFWRTFYSIQLPQIVGSLQIYTILIFIGAFNVFDLVYAVGGSSGGPGGAADVLGTLFYRISFGTNLNALGLSGALSVFMFVLVLVAILLINAVFERLRRRFE